MQRQKEPLRRVTAGERAALEQVARARSEEAERVVRAKALLAVAAVAAGKRFTDVARAVGRRSGDAIAALVTRFNKEGVVALDPRHGGGPPVVYDAVARERILREFGRTPDRERDGTATWSLTTLQRALRRAPDGVPTVSTVTILDTLLDTLHEAGYTWQKRRTWWRTGTVLRKRKRGTGTVTVEVTDPAATDATPKKR